MSDAPGRRALPQVDPDHYAGAYDSEWRFVSYWRQIELLAPPPGETVLEVGVGSGFVARYLRGRGGSVRTCDLDARLGPDVVGDVAGRLPFRAGAFAVVGCFEVLEHLPWASVPAALAELARVSRGRVVLSVPDVTPHYQVDLVLPLFGSWRRSWTIPWTRAIPWRRPQSHRFDGEHHWELGKKEYPERAFRAVLESVFVVERHFRPAAAPNHHFYVLRVRGDAR